MYELVKGQLFKPVILKPFVNKHFVGSFTSRYNVLSL